MTEATEATTEHAAKHQLRARVDWRTGQPMIEHDDAFWQGHDRRRDELGLSVAQYCMANGLAVSTFRHRVSGDKRQRSKASTSQLPTTRGQSGTPTFVAVAPPPSAPAAAVVEIAVDGMTVRLHGEAAGRVLDLLARRLG